MYRLATLLFVVIAIAVWRLDVTIETLCDLEQCPRCYTLELCDSMRHSSIRYESISDFVNMFFATKSVYKAWFNSSKVILKRLTKDPTSYHLKTCSDDDTAKIYAQIASRFDMMTESAINELNPEPFVLDLFKDGDWPVPAMVGMCGMLLVETDCGRPLLEYATSPWPIRAHIARQLLEAAVAFTRDHAHFRLYLTDISGDNIVVANDDRIYFVDLEHVILTAKTNEQRSHQSEFYQESDREFAYNEDDICSYGYSDHNIYALLLWELAPWPMFAGGLLYDADSHVHVTIEECVKGSKDRFETAFNLLEMLRGD